MCAAVKINRFGKFDLNPRGNLWLKDENRFGHKLLSKMGWSHGKGLGKNEDGIAENLKVKVKSGNTGVGWSEKIPLAAENVEYDAVLASLNEKFYSADNKTKKEEVKSLEQRSQQFKKRLHYGKFVRGKDVCRYSEKDMNSIFVTKKPKSEPTLARVKSTVTNIDSSSTEDEAPETAPTFKSRLSMKEYFDMKMKKKPDNTTNSNNDTETRKMEETVEKEVSSKKKSKNKRLKLDPQASDDSSSEEEILKHSFNLTESGIVEQPGAKKDLSSRKRSKTANTERSKRLKLDPDLVEEHSPTNSCISMESDSIIEISSSGIESTETSCSTITSEEQHEVESAVSKKKKKKAEKRKRVKTELVDISEESTSPEPNEEELKNDLVLLGEFPQSDIQILSKKRKKLTPKKSKKTKSDALTKLKTCLKGSWNYSLEKESRKVSFNEHVLYKTINSDAKTECPNESDISEPDVCLTADKSMDKSLAENKDLKEVTASAPTENDDVKKVTASALAENGVDSSLITNVRNANEPWDFEFGEMPNCMNLPKCNNSNSWLENQRLASKMKLYQNMIKKIKRHPILKTSNLLDIKGYGNWGF